MEAGAKARSVLTRERDEARRRAEANDQTIVALVQDRLQLKQQVCLTSHGSHGAARMETCLTGAEDSWDCSNGTPIRANS
jgi:hypothetical protein